ncbi:MAG: hypothetical protein A3F41_01875 [Coxiella sp. RIFCSPHIGHO2_12_FULL_44_14]|nr:MAG: hypothetical protein A3F41_01875 [Coxiella sp. RIFCSPHIGHO2_12_FULL_44_14]
MKNNIFPHLNTTYDVVGIGMGPFNLSLAALLDEMNNVHALFLEKKKYFSWHNNMLLDNAMLQVHYLKDLVTLIDPTNKFSFLSYLASEKRMCQFLNRKTNSISRNEFNQYYQWVASNVKNVKFEENVKKIIYHDRKFSILSENSIFSAKNIVIGTGTSPHIPPCFLDALSDTIMHNSEYMNKKPHIDFSKKTVMVIGGGQSGAEIIHDILSSNHQLSKLIWISRRSHFRPLEDDCFSNEFYTASYVNYFMNLPKKSKEKNLIEQKFTSDGITQQLSDHIYNKIYEMKFINKLRTQFTLLIRHSPKQIKKMRNKYEIDILNLDTNDDFIETADIVILATGYEYRLPSFIYGLFPDIKNVREFEFNRDFSIQWEHHPHNKIFIQNGSKHQFGVSDSNLSLLPWRNAIIINSLLNKQVYDVDIDQPIVSNAYSSYEKNNVFNKIHSTQREIYV